MTNKGISLRKIYDDFWIGALKEEKEDFGDLELSMLFIEKINLLKKHYSILEIGCGIGKFCNLLNEMDYRNIIGIDISPSAILYGKNRFSYLQLYCMDAESLGFRDNCFDICLSFDLVEHLSSINTHFKEVYRILKPAGKYLFHTPNIIMNSLFETIAYRGFSWRIYHPSLQHSWSLRKELLNVGFCKVEILKIPPLSTHKIKKIPKYAKWIFRHAPWERLPLFLQTNFYAIAYK